MCSLRAVGHRPWPAVASPTSTALLAPVHRRGTSTSSSPRMPSRWPPRSPAAPPDGPSDYSGKRVRPRRARRRGNQSVNDAAVGEADASSVIVAAGGEASTVMPRPAGSDPSPMIAVMRWSFRSTHGVSSCGVAVGWLEEFDDVAGGVLEQDLLAAGSFENVVAELSTSVTEAGDVGFNVVDDEVDAVPAAGSRL